MIVGVTNNFQTYDQLHVLLCFSNIKHKPKGVQHLRFFFFLGVRTKAKPKLKEYLEQANCIRTLLPKILLFLEKYKMSFLRTWKQTS